MEVYSWENLRPELWICQLATFDDTGELCIFVPQVDAQRWASNPGDSLLWIIVTYAQQCEIQTSPCPEIQDNSSIDSSSKIMCGVSQEFCWIYIYIYYYIIYILLYIYILYYVYVLWYIIIYIYYIICLYDYTWIPQIPSIWMFLQSWPKSSSRDWGSWSTMKS